MNHDSAEEALLPAEGDVGLYSWNKYFSQFLAHTETFLHVSILYNKNQILLRFFSRFTAFKKHFELFY